MFTRSDRTMRMCALLRGVNGTVEYTTIEGHFGAPLASLRPVLFAARRYLERDEGIVFETVRGSGLRRLTDAEKIASAASFSRRIRRTAVRGVTRLNAVSNPATLSNEDQLAATLRMTVFQAIQRQASQDREAEE